MHSMETCQNAISFYKRNATNLAEKYERLNFDEVHQDLIPFMPKLPARVLDVGAGSGRDAQALAERGYDVVAVEPAQELLEIGLALHGAPRISWLNDKLPALEKLEHGSPFQMILCSAVWMHLNRAEQTMSMRRLCELGAPGAHICITFRTAALMEPAPLFGVKTQDIVTDATAENARLVKQTRTADYYQRSGVEWHSLIFKVCG